MVKDNRLKIGLKYCGGCNPDYDRVAVKDQIEKSLKDKILFVSPESDDKDMVLAMEGCKIACADLSHFQGSKIFKITSVKDAEEFIKVLSFSTKI